jgi:hypothetical protein
MRRGFLGRNMRCPDKGLWFCKAGHPSVVEPACPFGIVATEFVEHTPAARKRALSFDTGRIGA